MEYSQNILEPTETMATVNTQSHFHANGAREINW
jgi:hypothetical protein